MSWTSRDDFGRTSKLILDSGLAESPSEAAAVLAGYRLQIIVDTSKGLDDTAEAALFTVVNAGTRAFQGGVLVYICADAPSRSRWARSQSLRDAIERFGGTVIDSPTDLPTLVIGSPVIPIGITSPVLHLCWAGWAGAAVAADSRAFQADSMPLAGVVAASLGLSEMFQRAQGDIVAGSRDVGFSLWRPGSDWRRETDAPPLQYLPASAWLLGLGHLGQGSIWSLGFLPYPTDSEPKLALMDTDVFVSANLDTGLLADAKSIGLLKTRVVAEKLKSIGFESAIIERRFDGTINPTANEPVVALAGFDNPESRRLVGQSFRMSVDAGLGSGPRDYLDILIHEFPGDIDAADAFPDDHRVGGPSLPEAYEREIRRQVESGIDEGDARCGVVEVAGATVGAAFVGALAGALSAASLLRYLHGGPRFTVVAIDLADPEFASAVETVAIASLTNPGFVSL